MTSRGNIQNHDVLFVSKPSWRSRFAFPKKSLFRHPKKVTFADLPGSGHKIKINGGSTATKRHLSNGLLPIFRVRRTFSHVYCLHVPLPRIPVTTRILIVFVVDPNLNLHLTHCYWEGGPQAPRFTFHRFITSKFNKRPSRGDIYNGLPSWCLSKPTHL